MKKKKHCEIVIRSLKYDVGTHNYTTNVLLFEIFFYNPFEKQSNRQKYVVPVFQHMS